MFSTISAFPGSTLPQRLNQVEPPWYGPVRQVVWEGRRREVSPYPDPRPLAAFLLPITAALFFRLDRCSKGVVAKPLCLLPRLSPFQATQAWRLAQHGTSQLNRRCARRATEIRPGETPFSRTKKHHQSYGSAILQNLTHATAEHLWVLSRGLPFLRINRNARRVRIDLAGDRGQT